MKEFFSIFAPYEWLLITFAIVYGFAFGVGNVLLRVRCICTGENFRQHEYGRLLDALWVFSLIIIYFIEVG